MPKTLRILFPLFLVSGFCGLIYESIWAKYLKLFLGHAAYAQTVVLIVFIGGMAIGAWICGRFAERIGNPLRAYALAEILIGVAAIAFHRIFLISTDWAYATLLPATCSADAACLSSWGLAAAIILPQSILLGTTFPLMTAGVIRAAPAEPGRMIALLYFLNSFGAVFGVLAGTFLLVPAVGLPGSSVTAGVVNIVLGAIVYAVSRSASSAVPTLADEPAPRSQTMLPRLLLWIALLTGLSSFIYEIVWIRMLSLVLGSSTDAFELMLASFILGLALGGAWIRKRIDKLADPRRFLAVVQIVMGLLALATIGLYNLTFDAMAWMLSSLAKTASGYLLYNVGSSLISMLIMLPPTFMAGMTLPLITYLLMKDGYGERGIGYVYAWNTLGAIVGVIAAVHVGLPWLGIKGSLVAGAAIDIALGCVLARHLMVAPEARRFALAVVGSVVLFAVGIQFLRVDPMRAASGVFRTGLSRITDVRGTVYQRDGKTASIDVIELLNGARVIRTNGKPDAGVQMRPPPTIPADDEPTMILAGALPFSYHHAIRKVAVIGFGSGLTTHTVLGAPGVTQVDTIEIEPAMVEGATAFLPRNRRAYQDPRSRIIYDDAKSFFARSGERYDVIVSEPSNPWVSGVASLFTTEFYQRARRHLNDGGLFVQWIQAYETDVDLLASIIAALDTSFADYVIYQNVSDLLIVASKDRPLPEPSANPFSLQPLAADLAALNIRGLFDLRDRRVLRKSTAHALFSTSATPANSDYFPYVDSRAAEARFRGGSVPELMSLHRSPIPIAELVEHLPSLSSATSPPPSLPMGPRQTNRARAARDMLDYLARSDGPSAAPASLEPGPRTGLAAYRAIFRECVPEPLAAAMWDDVLVLSSITSDLPDRDVLRRFWDDTAASTCLKRLPAKYGQWVDLFRAIGVRDTKAMLDATRTLLEARGNSSEQLKFLVLAEVTSLVAEGRSAEARRTLGEASSIWPPDERRTPWYLFLERLTRARPGSPPPADIAPVAVDNPPTKQAAPVQ